MELDVLLTPLAGDAPAGADLSFSNDYDAIREARRADDPTLAQGEWVTDLKSADWPQVASRCGELLGAQSKDLQLAVWWTEAQSRLRGFAGLADGYRLVAGLCDGFWDTLHPQADDGDFEQRIGTLTWLLAHSMTWMRESPLTQAPQGRFGLAEFEAARARRGDDSDGVPLATMEAARRASPHGFYVQLVESVAQCRAALQALEQSVDARLGMEGPSFTSARDQLGHLEDVARRFAREAGVLLDGDTQDSAVPMPESFADPPSLEPGPGAALAAAAPVAANGAITTRKEAIAQLRRVADFFRRTEPHSPVAYLADKAASWGEMPLHVWLKRVIKDDSTLAQMQELLDIGENGEALD
ncbi:type VI secretion system protein TssA [Aerolutibacter ruishenii]|uniref:Type VI secretion system protein ImpA n=1 Tax=Aerolutibacter ruishenii TaxID=686800 RepID=A0A562M0V7_9GAMM|nr:type VI secretion system protein TssA [Lysobacter ruishenii]TWI13575.1 type VI secretion system protein ImpA [Lysobacter ruishenii]